MYCHLRLTLDDRSQAVTAFEALDAVHDQGWTPPFRVARYPSIGALGILDGWESFKQAWSYQYQQGEASPVSVVNTQARHRNTTISSIPQAETVLVNGMIKFRAGQHTDRVGTETVGCPYHVPWVWCEMALTYANGQLKFYGRGSIFPSHAWYLDGKRVMRRDQVGDTTFPSRRIPVIGPPPSMPAPYFGPRLSIPNPLGIDVSRLALYSVLSKGASAIGPQTPQNADRGLPGSVETHPNTVSGGPVMTHP